MTFWRVIAFVAAALAVIAIGSAVRFGGWRPRRPHIARLEINGLITGDEETLKLIRDVGEFEGRRRGA